MHARSMISRSARTALLERRCLSEAATSPLFDKVLVANRGEIACRVMDTCKRLGIRTVAVYSDPDAHSKHVLMADEAVRVGTAASADSYLLGDRIIEACKQTGAQAVHPGYGFLSENSVFSEACAAAGIEFIGPNKHAIDMMGDKITSMKIAKEAGVSVAPKYDGEVENVEQALEVAEGLGYPIIMKASAGGGGKGMRVAWTPEELKEGYFLAKNEAMASFGDDRMLFAAFVCPHDGRHIEIQLIGDKHGNYACFPERECSIQRRNQKVIEESPSVLLSQETRLAMQRQAADLARAVGYHGAGTVEFLADDDQNFYFLEMNTRLQVEHPVTEEVSGEDLVQLMLEVSAGHELPERLRDPQLSADADISSCFSVPFAGWSMESRVYAEDPLRGFLPSIGRLTSYEEPTGDGVRVDSGIYQGAEISMHYDPMISKLITTAGTVDETTGERLPTAHGEPDQESEARRASIEKMKTALDSYVIRGLNENICFLRAVCDNSRFISGALTTEFIPDEYPDGFHGIALEPPQLRRLLAAAAQMYLSLEERAFTIATNEPDHHQEEIEIFAGLDEGPDTVMHAVSCYDEFGMGLAVASVGGEMAELEDIDWQTNLPLFSATDAASGEIFVVQMVQRLPEGFRLKFLGNTFDVKVRNAAQQRLAQHMIPKAIADTSKMIVAPMPGLLISLAVEAGQSVEAGQDICVLEAMKMQNVLKAEKKGVVKEVHGAAGDTVDVDQLIVLFE